MNLTGNQSSKKIDRQYFKFWHWFRLIFTLFSLYLMGDIFYRWDAFKFHSSFSEFLPNVALAWIIWSIVALASSIISWLPLKVFERSCGLFGLKIKISHLMIYLSIFLLLATVSWIGKKIIWSSIETSFQLKLTIIAFISCITVPLAWLLRSKAESWITAIQGRITPLVWLFAICVMFSLAVVSFHMWDTKTSKTIPERTTTSSVSRAGEERQNILLVTFDTLTARDMSVYGYHRETTPFIKSWASTASVFTRTQAGSNYTAATTPSIMTGKRTWTHRKYHHDIAAKPLKTETENLALVMKKNGYYTTAFIQNIVTTVEALGISNSIDLAPSVTMFSKPTSIEGIIEKYLSLLFSEKFTTYNWLGQDDFIFTVLLRRIPQKVSITEFPPELAFNKFFEVMDNVPRKPFFAWIHLMAPHAPQLPPPPFAGIFNPSMELRVQNKQHTFNTKVVRYDSRNLPWPNEVKTKVTLLRDYYDEFILYCDKQFENFISEVQKRDWSKNTVIILSSDHGESFEHDYFLHKPTHLYEQVTHIPLIIKEPKQTGAVIIDNLVEQVDIPATILDLADIPVPSWIEGRSVLPLLRNEKLPAKKAISMSLYKNVPADPITKGIIAVWEYDYKLIHYLDKKKSLLFNLKEDPDELNNLFDKETATGTRLLSFIKDNLKEANKRIIAEK